MTGVKQASLTTIILGLFGWFFIKSFMSNVGCVDLKGFCLGGFFIDGMSMFFNWERQVWTKLGLLHKAPS